MHKLCLAFLLSLSMSIRGMDFVALEENSYDQYTYNFLEHQLKRSDSLYRPLFDEAERLQGTFAC